MAADIDKLLARADKWLDAYAETYAGHKGRCAYDWVNDLAAALRADTRLFKEMATSFDELQAENETARAVIDAARDLLTDLDANITGSTADYLAQATARLRALLASIEDAPREPAGDGTPAEGVE